MITYEWLVETVATVATDQHEEGEVVDHFHARRVEQMKRYLHATPVPEGCRYDVCLVREQDGHRCWAYARGGQLPLQFADAWGTVTKYLVPVTYRIAFAGRA